MTLAGGYLWCAAKRFLLSAIAFLCYLRTLNYIREAASFTEVLDFQRIKLNLRECAIMSKLIESKKIADVLNYAEKDTLVLFDVDNTLIWSVEEFGSQPWFVHIFNQFQKKGFCPVESMEKSRLVLEQIEELVFFKPVEPDTLNVLEALNKKSINTLGLTRRILSDANITVKQLLSVGIDFSQNSLYEKEEVFTDTFGFSKGILYAGLDEEKGSGVIKFLEKIDHKPKNILFVDDARHHVEEVYQSLNDYGIPNICIRYAGADDRLEKFDPARADRDLIASIGKERFDLLFKELL